MAILSGKPYNIIVVGKTVDSIVETFLKCLTTYWQLGSNLKARKWNLFPTEVEYLWHCVFAEGIAAHSDKQKAVMELEIILIFLEFFGFCSFYRRFEENFAGIAKLHELN